MKASTSKYPPWMLVVDAIVVLLCVLGCVTTWHKADLPFSPAEDGQYLTLTDLHGDLSQVGLHPGDEILAINGYAVQENRDVEHIIDGQDTRDTVSITVRELEGIRETRVPLIRFYSIGYIVIQCGVSAIILFIGILTLLKKPKNRDAMMLHWIAISTALLIMLTWGAYKVLPMGLGYLLRGLFPSAAIFTGATLLHFSVIYPAKQSVHSKTLLRAIYAVSTLLGIAGLYTSFRATLPLSMEWTAIHIHIIIASRLVLMVLAVAAIGMFVHSYRQSREVSQRKKLRWILFGFAVSIAGFMLLWQLPQLLTGAELIPEEVMLLIVMIFPICMAISIIRYHLFDIDTFIQRSSVYGVVFVVLFLLFVGTQHALIDLFGRITMGNQRIAALLSGGTIIIAFQPTRHLVKKLLDRWFFQINYNFREAVRLFLESIKKSADADQLAELLVDKTRKFIPVDKVAVVLYHPDTDVLECRAQHAYPLLEQETVVAIPRALTVRNTLPITTAEKVENDVPINSSDVALFEAFSPSTVFPLATESGALHGYVLMGNKRSGFPYSLDDVELMKTVAYQSGMELERITLQRRLMEKRAEAARLEEMNRMKSFFVATVSHDLKTPLTSIKMFAELLRTKRHKGSIDVDEYLAIIEGECERLTHLINNVLDYSKIEAGVKHYTFTLRDAQNIVRQALEIMKYPLSMRQFTLDVHLLENEYHILADQDAIIEALINILSNAIKYSPKTRHVTVSTAIDSGYFTISVADKGAGIAPEDQAHIFESFYRANDIVVRNTVGTGLGLAIVKHVVDAHQGRVAFKSTPGVGTTFTLSFPLSD